MHRYILPVMAVLSCIVSAIFLTYGPARAHGWLEMIRFFGLAGIWVVGMSCAGATLVSLYLTFEERWKLSHASQSTKDFFWRVARSAASIALVFAGTALLMGVDRYAAQIQTRVLEPIVLERTMCENRSGTQVKVTIEKPTTDKGLWCFAPTGTLQSGLRDTVYLHPKLLNKAMVDIKQSVNAALHWYPSVLSTYGYFLVVVH